MAVNVEAWRFGAPVAGYAWRVEEAKANLLLMHGYGEYATRYVAEYNQLIPALNKAGISVFAFDANGHGASPGPRGATDMKQAVHHHQMAREALALESKAPILLFGHSLGGLITAASVAGKPARVQAVVLSAPALQIKLNPVLKTLAGLIAAIAPAARLTPPLEAEAISRDGAVVEAYRNNPDVITKPPAARLGATAVSVLETAWTKFSAWKAPVLIIHGDADRLTPIEGSQRFFETIGVSDKTLDVFEGGYHELLNDTERDRALAVILSWIERHLP